MARGKRDEASEPKLLSGGNPQIAKGDGPEPVRAYLAAMPGWKGDIGRAVDAAVERLVPHVRKAVRWNSPFYGVEGNGWFLTLHCFTKYVKVSFLNGDRLTPPPPEAAKATEVRSVHLREGEGVNGQLERWIAAAAAHPGSELF